MSTPKPLVMLVEDDARIADMLLNYLSASGFDTCHLADGLAALHHLTHAAGAAPASNGQPFALTPHAVPAASAAPPDTPGAPPATFPASSGASATAGLPRMPDLLLLDLMLPGMDGMAVCREVRRFSALPIVMVTARVDEIDRLLGLDTGADDYICKPFSPREVVARVRAHLRRASGQLVAQPVATEPPAQSWWVSASQQQVFWQGNPLPLTPVEFRLLQLLASRPGQVFGRARLLDQLHEDQRDVSDRAVDSHIKNIRRKLAGAGADALHITSVYGVGYRLEHAD